MPVPAWRRTLVLTRLQLSSRSAPPATPTGEQCNTCEGPLTGGACQASLTGKAEIQLGRPFVVASEGYLCRRSIPDWKVLAAWSARSELRLQGGCPPRCDLHGPPRCPWR